jgi:hypothetical protein
LCVCNDRAPATSYTRLDMWARIRLESCLKNPSREPLLTDLLTAAL